MGFSIEVYRFDHFESCKPRGNGKHVFISSIGAHFQITAVDVDAGKLQTEGEVLRTSVGGMLREIHAHIATQRFNDTKLVIYCESKYFYHILDFAQKQVREELGETIHNPNNIQPLSEDQCR